VPFKKFILQDVTLEIPEGMLNRDLEQALEQGRYDASEARAVKQLLRPDDTYFEIGAGVGFLSTIAHRIVGEADRIHVYEANPALIPVIRRNWKTNGVAGKVYHCLLGTMPGEYDFHVSPVFWASSRDISYGYGKTIKVPQRDFLHQLDKKAATFLAVNVHGGERDLLDKVLSPRLRVVLAKFHPRVIGVEMVDALRRHLEEQGFEQVPGLGDAQSTAWIR
jgi:FkbM family methyltransferase